MFLRFGKCYVLRPYKAREPHATLIVIGTIDVPAEVGVFVQTGRELQISFYKMKQAAQNDCLFINGVTSRRLEFRASRWAL